MNRIYILLAGIAIAAGIFLAGMKAGKMGMAVDLSQQAVERQEKITRLTLRLSKAEREIDEKMIKTVEVIRNVKDPNACADVAIPDSVAASVR